jgi:tight adherence protein C
MILLLIFGVALLGLAVAALLRGMTVRRVKTSERLAAIDEYGFSAESTAPEIVLSGDSEGVAGFVSAVGAAFAQRVGSVREEDIRAELMAAGMYNMSPRMLIGYRVIAALVFPALIVLFGGISLLTIGFAALMVFAGWMLPLIIVRRKARQRLTMIERRIPDMIDLLVVTIEAGLGFGGALRLAAEHLGGPLSDELRLTLQEQTMGLGVDDALSNMATRADTPAMRAFVRALVQASGSGSRSAR